MDIPLNVDVHCQDGRCGRSTYVVVNPATEKVTHLVVREQRPSRTERLVPVESILTTTRDVIVLSQTREQFIHLDAFNQTDFVQREVAYYASDPKLTLLWPYRVPVKKIVSEDYQQVPPGELAVRRGTRVKATDGRIGRVDEFMVDRESGHITHLVLREGLPWDRKHVDIPISEIARIEEDVVHLKLSKKDIEALPFIKLR